jgi:hypothetical protein
MLLRSLIQVVFEVVDPLIQVVFEVVDPSKPKRFFEVVQTLLQAEANF